MLLEHQLFAGHRRQSSTGPRSRVVSVCLTEADEDFLIHTYPGTFSDAIRGAIKEAQQYRRMINSTEDVSHDNRDR
jgi:hypothetical protein